MAARVPVPPVAAGIPPAEIERAVTATDYALFGLVVRSTIALPGLVRAPRRKSPDISIRRQTLPFEGATRSGYSIVAEGTLLEVPGVGRYLIRDGREILVDADASGSERNLRLFLLGSALGAALHQRGLLPLHANAIEIDGRVVAFAGPPGAGKSTLAAWFHDRGYPILTDDVCVVAHDMSRTMAYPGLPRLRLWQEALEASGRFSHEYDRSFDGLAKFDVPVRLHTDGALPLDRVYQLYPSSIPGGRFGIDRLRGVEAVDALVINTYRGHYLREIGRTREHLMACVRLANSVPVFAVSRNWGYGDFQRQAEAIEQHARTLA